MKGMCQFRGGSSPPGSPSLFLLYFDRENSVSYYERRGYSMKSFKDIRFYYYWSKGEKALKDRDEKTANKCKKKLIRLYPKN
jgi:hypothetical protein